jgi:membrane-bound lytic murein transglycosylase B
MRCMASWTARRTGARDGGTRRGRCVRLRARGIAGAAILSVAAALHGQSQPPRPADTPPPFEHWRAQLVEEARRKGFSRRVVAEALGDVRPSQQVIQADRAQAGPSQGLDSYLARRLTPELVAHGRTQMRTHRALLDRIEQWFGVQRRFVVAIWGAETSYGPYTGDVPVFQALATLAWEPRRAEYFRAELFEALRIVQREHIDVSTMRGSWAGAMGQPQFMPSSYHKYAYDFDRDGRRDIWGSTADTLASIANYLRSFGWWNGEQWGREVMAPRTVRERILKEVPVRTEGCGAIRALTLRRPVEKWAADGLRGIDGSPLPRSRVPASLVVTTDARAFLVYRNYESILAYNCSHYYALGVALLADRLQ